MSMKKQKNDNNKILHISINKVKDKNLCAYECTMISLTLAIIVHSPQAHHRFAVMA